MTWYSGLLPSGGSSYGSKGSMEPPFREIDQLTQHHSRTRKNSGGSRGVIQGCKGTPLFSCVLSPSLRSRRRSLRGEYCACYKMCSVRRASPTLSASVARLYPAQCRVDMWKSCTVDAVVADGFALTSSAKLCARLCFVENRASRYSWSASGNEHY